MTLGSWRVVRSAGGALVATLALAALVGGCGSSSSDDGSSSPAQSETSTQGSGEQGASADKVLAAGFAGKVRPAPTSGPKAQPGKTVWLLSCLGYEGCQRSAKGIVAAAKELGWNLKVFDNKADPTTTISLIRQAISAGVDGVIENPIDCPSIKSGLLAAKAARIPVIAMSGLDCDHAVFDGGESLFAANTRFGGDDWADRWANTARSDAAFVLALAQKKGIAKPKIIQVRNDDQALQAAHAKAFESEIKARCPDCQVDPLRFTIAQLGAGKGPQIYKSGVLAHRTNDVLYYNFDSQLPAGLQAAIQAAGGSFKVVCCGDGDQQGYKNLRARVSTAMNAYPFDWMGWATADMLNRVFAGETTFPFEGGENLYVDVDHNLPPVGEYAFGSYDYKAAYQKVWSGR